MSKSIRQNRQGKILVLFVLLLPVIMGMGAFAIDGGYVAYSRGRLQVAARAAALAALDELPDVVEARARGQVVANQNFVNTVNVVADSDIEFGTWEESAFTVTTADEANAVRVTARLSQQNASSLSLFLGGFLGVSSVDLDETAIAAVNKGGAALTARFLIDEDMFDKDVSDIEDLASALGQDAQDLVTARGFNLGKSYGSSSWEWEDNFLDIPAGTKLMLPTGQGENYDNNDAGLFDMTAHSSFEFWDHNDLVDFLFYSESGGDSSKWGTDLSWVLNKMDPLKGVAPVTDDSSYAGFVDPDTTHISPVFESDISTLNMSGDEPRVNAKGLRRGLIAYKIAAVGNDPDGSGTDLPFLELEIVDPSTISLDDLNASGSGGSGSGLSSEAQIVQ